MNSKAKGNSFERSISDSLSLWLTKGEEKRACWRSDTSGAAATVFAKKNQEQRYVQANAGDIRQVCVKGIYPDLDSYFESFVIECKNYAAIDFYPPFNKTLTGFFDACIREKATTGKAAVLILKAKHKKILYCQEPNKIRPNTPKLFTIYYGLLTLDIYMFDDVINTPFINDDITGREGNQGNIIDRSSEL